MKLIPESGTMSHLSSGSGFQAGRGAEWIAAAARPWDPPLAANGRQQAEAAAARLRKACGSDRFEFGFRVRVCKGSVRVQGSGFRV